MPIVVICPSCHARFNVSEKFAGKQGPCPKCKAPITIPKLEDEVKVHAPEQFGGVKDTKGRPVLKPIEREETKLQPMTLAMMGAGVLAVFAVAFVLGRTPAGHSWAVLSLGLLVLSPPLVLGGYFVLRDDELEPYRGRELVLRILACAAVYGLLWAGYGVLNDRIEEPIMWAFYAAPFLVIGTVTALAAFDLDGISAFFHYAFYLGVTILLRLTIGLPLLTIIAPES